MSEMRTRVWLGDVELTEYFRLVDVVRPYPIRSATIERAPGFNVGVVTSSSYDPIEITMRLVCTGGNREERRELIRWLVSILDFDEPRMLEFSDDGGRYYKVVPSGGGSRSATFRSDSVEITFTAPDPVMFGRTHRYERDDLVDNEIFVDGTAQTIPRIEASVTATNVANEVRIFVDYGSANGQAMIFDVGDTNTHTLFVDCENEVATLDGVSIVPSMLTDWIKLTPGDHHITLEGFNFASAIEFEERWL